MTPDDLNDAERLVWAALPLGELVDLREAEHREVRASVIRSLLLGAVPSAPGAQAALMVTGARITGSLGLTYARIACPIELHDGEFTEPIELYGARLGHLSLRGSRLAGLFASHTMIEGNLQLQRSRCTGTVYLTGATVTGTILLNGAHLCHEELAFGGTSLTVGHDILAHNGFVCHGEIRLNDAEIGGSLRWEGAQLINPDGCTLFAPDISIGAIANLCDGFRSHGRIRLGYARIGSRLCFDGAEITAPDERGVVLSYLQAHDLVLQPARPVIGEVDLSHARIGVLRDDPATWPKALKLNGFRYESISGIEAGVDRLRWLRLDPGGYQPQPYEHLAEVYRQSGRDREARDVLLAKQRHRREQAPLAPRLWGYLQDLIVGYGYRPGRATAILAFLLAVGTVAFSLRPPTSADPAAPDFSAPVYTLDLLLPIIDFGLQGPYHSHGLWAWLGYGLVGSGWILATTVAAGATRVLRRN